MDERWKARAKVEPKAVVLFTRELSTLINAGVPLVRALDVASEQESPVLCSVVEEVTRRVNEGLYLSQALAQFPAVFSETYLNLVRVGEASGSLDQCLERLAEWLEADFDRHNKVKGALAYPAFALSITLLCTLGVFIWILPGFTGLFRDMNVELPWVTRMVMHLTWAATSPVIWLLVGCAATEIFFLYRGLMKTDSGRLRVYRFVSKIPAVGGLLTTSALVRYCTAISLCLHFGVDILKSLTLAAGSSGSPEFTSDLRGLLESVKEGQPISEHYATNSIYPGALVSLIRVAEETSSLTDMYAYTAQFYGEELETRIATLGALLEPLLLAMVSAIVGVVAISIYLPIYGMLQQFGI